MKRLFAMCAASMFAAPALAAENKDQIGHIIVISLENHSFDNVFGNFPGAEGLAQAKKSPLQVDADGKPYDALPPVRDFTHTPLSPPAPVDDKRFPEALPNAPFAIDDYVGKHDEIPDPTHRFAQEQEQIDGGKMDKFASISSVGGLVMGYYDGSQFGLWDYAKKYTLDDHFFHAAFGGSYLNHMWLICACTPQNEAMSGQKSEQYSQDGYAVNTVFSSQNPHPPQIHDASKLLPPVTLPTIGDRLSEKNISWAWYAGGWSDAEAGHAAKDFQFHHQPFTYFKAYDEGTQGRKDHLKDESDLMADIERDTLPAVVFYKPGGEFNLHPGYAQINTGDAHIVALLKAIEASKAWASSVVIITFDENGGFWDHVAPPKIDRWGPGTRVPTLVVSPMAKKGFVDHTVYDSTSILKFIEWRYDLKALAARDAKANNMLNALVLN